MLGECCQKFGPTRAKIGQTSPMPGQCWTKFAEIGPKLDESGRRILGGFGPSWSNFGQIWLTRPRIGRTGVLSEIPKADPPLGLPKRNRSTAVVCGADRAHTDPPERRRRSQEGLRGRSDPLEELPAPGAVMRRTARAMETLVETCVLRGSSPAAHHPIRPTLLSRCACPHGPSRDPLDDRHGAMASALFFSFFVEPSRRNGHRMCHSRACPRSQSSASYLFRQAEAALCADPTGAYGGAPVTSPMAAQTVATPSRLRRARLLPPTTDHATRLHKQIVHDLPRATAFQDAPCARHLLHACAPREPPRPLGSDAQGCAALAPKSAAASECGSTPGCRSRIPWPGRQCSGGCPNHLGGWTSTRP